MPAKPLRDREDRDEICGYQPNPLAATVYCDLELGHSGTHGFAPTKQREGDQRLPDGDERLTDDQQILMDEIAERRQVGIERYGQGHRPFNGRDTLQDLFEEQLDFMVYLTSIRRMSIATRDDLIPLVEKEISGFLGETTLPPIVTRGLAEHIVDRIMGWVVGQHINQNGRIMDWVVGQHINQNGETLA